jgi:rubrerythrin
MAIKHAFVALLTLGALGVGVAITTGTAAMNEQTRKNLMTAMHGEAFAYAKYLLYADHARQSGHTEIADLFERTAKTERLEHLAEEAQLVGLVGDDAANLRDAIAGESAEVSTMYREFAEQARSVGDTAAAERFEEIRHDEMTHRDEFKAALAKLEHGARQ